MIYAAVRVRGGSRSSGCKTLAGALLVVTQGRNPTPNEPWQPKRWQAIRSQTHASRQWRPSRPPAGRGRRRRTAAAATGRSRSSPARPSRTSWRSTSSRRPRGGTTSAGRSSSSGSTRAPRPGTPTIDSSKTSRPSGCGRRTGAAPSYRYCGASASSSARRRTRRCPGTPRPSARPGPPSPNSPARRGPITTARRG